ncbi:MAG: class I SAM-dependent methyltransferase [Proteobacteria bacterium]|nr:MAG: class I SAM-dependent methyltransferase [Pseudomonadota bacterium]
MAEQRYYFDHETAYQRIRQNNEVGWQKKTLADFRSVETEAVIAPLIAKYISNAKQKTALDLGCGSGPTAHFLADLGFKASGIDISPSAIELANEMATRFNKDILFEVGDVLELEHREETYDLIYDSHCIHCVVLDTDRRRLFHAIAAALKTGGIFILDTMAFRASADVCARPEPLRFDDDYILWHRTKKSSMSGVVEHEGELWCPQRRIYPEKLILDELTAAGLRIVETSLEDQGSAQPFMLRAVCTPSG